MYRDRINELLNILGATNQEIAQYANCAASTISRLRSGARKPNPSSPTTDTFINGVIQYATSSGQLDKISGLVGADDISNVNACIRRYLYTNEDLESAKPESDKPMPISSFSTKLDMSMNLCDISNVKLAHMVNIDASYVSRFRNGIRSPKSNPELLDRICTALFKQTASKGLLHELAGLINYTITSNDTDDNINTDELYLHFHAWMDDFSVSDHQAVRHLLESINTFQTKFDIAIPPLHQIVPDDIMNDKSILYQGISGLQRAVLRFLGGAIKEHCDELLLYSDQEMNWMTDNDDFRARWSALMVLCVRQGTHIRIIHNIDRDIEEMIEAVESWLPLYASGMITSYYNRKSCGTRFKHSIFLCPGKACISSFHPCGNSDNSIYIYSTDPAYLEFMNNSYECLINDSSSLVAVSQGTLQNIDDSFTPDDYYINLSLSVTQNKVIVVKKSAPNLTITFNHPLMCSAFQAYIDRAIDVQK